MPGQARQPSFGGVAQLFGDSDAADEPSKPKARQSSFGGVASLFGDDDDAGAVSNTSSAAAGRRAPSFGGVANLFGGHDDEPPKVGAAVTGTGGRAGRQASFGGVAALFGDEDEEVPDRINTKPKKSGARQASFGGVAALFGEDDGAGPAAGAPPAAPIGSAANSKPAAAATGAKAKTKKRDPSFSGVANLFGDEDEEVEETQTVQETIAPLQNIPKTGARTKKRDPSFGGVAGLFADNDDDDEEDEEELNITFKTTVNSKLTTDLQIQVENEREKVVELEGDLAKATQANDDLEERIRELENEITSLTQSKMFLIQQTSQEIDRMRELIQLSFTDQASKAKAATVG